MGEHAPSRAAGIEAVRATYAAINRNDLEGLTSAFEPDVEWVEPPGFPGAGTCHGGAAVLANITEGRSRRTEGCSEPERFIVAGDRIVVFLHVRVRLEGHADWIEAHMADVHTFRNGRPVQVRTFADGQGALEWVGAALLMLFDNGPGGRDHA